jgi:hypothetical protein
MKSRRNPTSAIDPASFRDPDGFVFSEKGRVFRQVNPSYKKEYDHLMASGLYDELLGLGLIVPHKEIGDNSRRPHEGYKVIEPRTIDFISYPYEWCFSQLRDAALAVLEIQNIALRYGMVLKDSSAYNMQFMDGKPVLIDTLSFSFLQEGEPWTAYRQFCQHFVAPLALMSLVDVRLGQLSRIHVDGVPLPLTRKLLSGRGLFDAGIWLHLKLHARAQERYAGTDLKTFARKRGFSKQAHIGLVESLANCVVGLKLRREGSNWGGYYSDGSTDSNYLEHKKVLVREIIQKIKPRDAWDLGSNTGLFSRLTADGGISTVAFDSDIHCVEESYRNMKRDGLGTLLPLWIDFANPSPAIGWEHSERRSLIQRGPVDVVLALALVHHLAISNNIPFHKMATFFWQICSNLVVEFVPRDDPMVEKLLSSRKDTPLEYSQRAFESGFSANFRILSSYDIGNSRRKLYFMKKKPS